MKYLIDTASPETIRRYCETFPISGVTTNPTIISKEKSEFRPLIRTIREIIGPERMLVVQTTASDAGEIVSEAEKLREVAGDPFYIKIPVTAEGLKAIPRCKKLGIGVTVTTVFTPQQALLAAVAGADYVAPFVNRLDNIAADGARVVGEIVELFKRNGLGTRVLAASFKNVEQIHRVSLAGADAVTIHPDLFDLLLSHPLTASAIDAFTRDWKAVYGDKKISDLL